MNFWVQYHNAEKLGDLPGDFPYDPDRDVCTLDTSSAEPHTISTSKPDILNALGDVVFMIVRLWRIHGVSARQHPAAEAERRRRGFDGRRLQC